MDTALGESGEQPRAGKFLGHRQNLSSTPVRRFTISLALQGLSGKIYPPPLPVPCQPMDVSGLCHAPPTPVFITESSQTLTKSQPFWPRTLGSRWENLRVHPIVRAKRRSNHSLEKRLTKDDPPFLHSNFSLPLYKPGIHYGQKHIPQPTTRAFQSRH